MSLAVWVTMKVELRFETFYYTPDGDWVMDDDWHKDPIAYTRASQCLIVKNEGGVDQV